MLSTKISPSVDVWKSILCGRGQLKHIWNTGHRRPAPEGPHSGKSLFGIIPFTSSHHCEAEFGMLKKDVASSLRRKEKRLEEKNLEKNWENENKGQKLYTVPMSYT